MGHPCLFHTHLFAKPWPRCLSNVFAWIPNITTLSSSLCLSYCNTLQSDLPATNLTFSNEPVLLKGNTSDWFPYFKSIHWLPSTYHTVITLVGHQDLRQFKIDLHFHIFSHYPICTKLSLYQIIFPIYTLSYPDFMPLQKLLYLPRMLFPAHLDYR